MSNYKFGPFSLEEERRRIKEYGDYLIKQKDKKVNEELLGEIQKLVWKLVNIANGDSKTKILFQREAYLAVRVMDLAESFISQVEDDRFIDREVNMAVDQDGNWIGHLNNIEMTDLELDFYNQVKRIMMDMKYNLLDFKKVIDFLKKIDINNMTLLEAVIINMLTGKTFVKNSWSDEAKSRLQTFIYDRKLITQDGNEVSTKSGSIKIEAPERYSLYRGKYISLIDSNNEKVQRMKHLEKEIMPFYNKIKEYEDLKRELNL